MQFPTTNAPTFFSPDEVALFYNFMDHHAEGAYFVVFDDGELIGCGGVFLNHRTGEAGLSWGMIHAQVHNKGIEKFFTNYRIALLKNRYPGKTYKIETSQHTFQFYHNRGFVTTGIILNGFGEGMDKYTMELKG